MTGYIKENPRLGTLAIAWVATKFTEPLRLGATVVIAPKIAKYIYSEKPRHLTPFQW